MNKCLNCENEFKSIRGDAKFCSDLCRATFHQNIKYNEGEIHIKVYGLVNPETDLIFYVGKTVGSLAQRLNAHIKENEGNKKKLEIISGLKTKNIFPYITLLEEIICRTEEEEEEALMKEKLWIDEIGKKSILCNIQGLNNFKPRMLKDYKKNSKTDKKTSGIRFKVSEVELVKKRESLKTLQEVYDFLISEYMKLYKIEKPSIFLAEQPKVYDAPPLSKNYFSDEPKQWDEPKKKELSNFESWKKEISGCDELYELEKLVSLMEKDKDLLWNEKNELKRFCLQIGKQKGFQ